MEMCGHTGYCLSCLSYLQRVCPVCRDEITEVQLPTTGEKLAFSDLLNFREQQDDEATRNTLQVTLFSEDVSLLEEAEHFFSSVYPPPVNKCGENNVFSARFSPNVMLYERETRMEPLGADEFGPHVTEAVKNMRPDCVVILVPSNHPNPIAAFNQWQAVMPAENHIGYVWVLWPAAGRAMTRNGLNRTVDAINASPHVVNGRARFITFSHLSGENYEDEIERLGQIIFQIAYSIKESFHFTLNPMYSVETKVYMAPPG